MRNDKILSDIKRITESILQNQFSQIQELYQELFSTYKNELSDLEGSLLPLHDMSVLFQNLYRERHEQLPRNEYPENYKKNLIIIRGKLELLLPDPVNNDTKNGVSVSIFNDNKSSASNSVTMNINITFDDVKNQISSMEDVLGYDDVQLIKSKIDELQKIVESNTKKSEKWKNAKAIGKWIFDKSVDVGIALLPLLLKINQ
jgi:hypothetical protein